VPVRPDVPASTTAPPHDEKTQALELSQERNTELEAAPVAALGAAHSHPQVQSAHTTTHTVDQRADATAAMDCPGSVPAHPEVPAGVSPGGAAYGGPHNDAEVRHALELSQKRTAELEAALAQSQQRARELAEQLEAGRQQHDRGIKSAVDESTRAVMALLEKMHSVQAFMEKTGNPVHAGEPGVKTMYTSALARGGMNSNVGGSLCVVRETGGPARSKFKPLASEASRAWPHGNEDQSRW